MCWGSLTLACTALVPEVKRAVPIRPFLPDYQRGWTIDQDVEAYEELRTCFRGRDRR